jgi:hypothetical protein
MIRDDNYEYNRLENIIKNRAEKMHLVDNHARILFSESKLDLRRISNMKNRWETKAQEGLLPTSGEIGVFETLSNIVSKHQKKLAAFFDPRIVNEEDLYQKWIRNFEDIIELTDELKAIHRLLAIAERCYWQRMEGFEGGAIDAVRRGTVSEVGAIQQVYNAADFLCLSLGDKVRRIRKTDRWKGLVVFGEQHEFMHYEDYIFAPDYAKLHGINLWLYFAHEVVHYLINRRLKRMEDFLEVFEGLKAIFSEEPSLVNFHAEPEYLAEETIADVMATLLVGEQYVLTLTDLKYYPSVIVGERKYYLQRFIQYPMLLRVLVCNWATKIAWGFESRSNKTNVPIGEDEIVLKTIESVVNEDLIEHVRTALYLYQPLERLKSNLKEGTSITETRRKLAEVLFHQDELLNECVPRIMRKILVANVIPRVKKLVTKDFYNTLPAQYFFNVKLDDHKSVWKRQVKTLSPECLIPTRFANEIMRKKKSKRISIARIKRRLNNREIIINQDPRDIVFSVAELLRESSMIKRNDRDLVAILSISQNEGFKNRRFVAPFGREKMQPEMSIH